MLVSERRQQVRCLQVRTLTGLGTAAAPALMRSSLLRAAVAFLMNDVDSTVMLLSASTAPSC
jgi:hypothetical protein